MPYVSSTEAALFLHISFLLCVVSTKIEFQKEEKINFRLSRVCFRKGKEIEVFIWSGLNAGVIAFSPLSLSFPTAPPTGNTVS
jgi:hypothetical protein